LSSAPLPSGGRSPESSGVLFGLAAFGIWGFAPAYWKAVGDVPVVEVLAHRVLWSFAIALCLLVVTRGMGEWQASLRNPRHVLPVGFAAFLLAANWGVFIYAVSSEQVLATSLGYYLNPLFNIVLGLVVLKERLRPLQWLAVAIATTGVGYYMFALGELPWISVVLAGSFGLYGLVRKMSPVEPVVGFGVEMGVLSLPGAIYIGYLAAQGQSNFPAGVLREDLLIAGTGLLTAAPLLCFNAAARRLPYVTIGILQYLAPSLTLVLAVSLYGEPFTTVHGVTFGCVWAALAIFTLEAVLFARRAPAPA
jgi:chloramphenicol-sensitive protein RarD